MIRRLVLLLALSVLAVGGMAAAPVHAQQPQPRTSLADLEDEVMCITCGTALGVSESPSADTQREFIRRQIAQGKTKRQVKAALVTQYGPNVLAEPRSNTVWLVPLIAALLAVGGVGLTVARWRRRGRETGYRNPDDAPEGPLPALDPADAARLDRDMAAFDR